MRNEIKKRIDTATLDLDNDTVIQRKDKVVLRLILQTANELVRNGKLDKAGYMLYVYDKIKEE